MQQLPLPVRLRASSVFSSYYAGSNRDVVQCLQRQQFGASPLVYLYGAPGVGKTHLLQALCKQVSEQGQSVVYIPTSALLEFGEEFLTSNAHSTILCVDDVDALLVDMKWNRTLFQVYRDLEERQCKLIVSAQQPPASYRLPLADFSSRVMAGTVLRLQLLNDDEQLQALRLHATQRGLDLPEDVGLYLLRRLPRDMNTLCSFLDDLDIASLAAQRKLTVPFVKSIIDTERR
jgi:DnaA family protein